MRTLCFIAALMLWTELAAAQTVSVQQPVIGTFSTPTTVSVPDRGSLLLGGVASAASGRITTGPFRSGSSLGWERQSSSTTVHVYIHDLRAMDEALLAEGTDADDGLASVSARQSDRYGLASQRRSTLTATDTRENLNRVDQASRLEALAHAAEARGKSGVAKLHWQMAAKYGSKLALARLTGPEPAVRAAAAGTADTR